MTFRSDSGGWAFRASEWKLSLGASTWGTRLSQLHKQTGTVRLMTYSLPSLAYIRTQFARRPWGVWVLCHSNFESRAAELKREFPALRIAVHPTLHAKVLLIEPATLWIGSANFGDSGWIEIMAGIRSKDAHDRCAEYFDKQWLASHEIAPS